MGSYEYGQTGKGNGSGGGPNEALRFELNPDASDHTFVRPKNGALPSNQSIWELLSGVNPFSISSNGTSRFTWSGISQGYADFLTLARVTFNYRRVSEEIQKVKQAFVESIRFTDFEPSAESTRVSLGASMFTVQPFDHTLGILRSINIAWEASGHFEGSTGDSRGGFAEISSSGSSKVGGHRYNDTGSGTGLGAGPNSHLSLTLGPVMSEYHFEEPSAGQAYDREIWNILTGDSPYTISHLENQLWYSGIETGGATFPATAVVTYNYLPYLTPKPVLNDVPGPAGLLGVCSFLHVTRRIRNRKNQLQ